MTSSPEVKLAADEPVEDTHPAETDSVVKSAQKGKRLVDKLHLDWNEISSSDIDSDVSDGAVLREYYAW